MELQNSTSATYPCAVCGTSVRAKQGAVECDSCGQWQHLKCETGISWKSYRAAIKNCEDIPFTCQRCQQGQTRGSSSNGRRRGSSSNGRRGGSSSYEPLGGSSSNGRRRGSSSNGPLGGSVSNGPQGGSLSNGPLEGNRRKRSLENAEADEEVQMESMLSEEANREVRDKYWDLMAVVQEHNEEEKLMETHNIQMLLLKANEVFEKVKRPREAAIDSQLLKVCGSLTKVSIESSQSSLPVFKPREFAEKLISFMMDKDDENEDDEEENSNVLNRLGRMTQSMNKSVQGVEPLLSAMEWVRPAQQAKSKKNTEEQEVLRQKKVEISMGDEEKETEGVAWKLKILKQCYAANRSEPICLYSFIVDPKSYSSTIENLFHLSLLIRELYVEVLEDEDGLAVIQPTQISPTGGEGDHDKQCILSMDMEEWKEIIETFNITSAMIPPMKISSRKRK